MGRSCVRVVTAVFLCSAAHGGEPFLLHPDAPAVCQAFAAVGEAVRARDAAQLAHRIYMPSDEMRTIAEREHATSAFRPADWAALAGGWGSFQVRAVDQQVPSKLDSAIGEQPRPWTDTARVLVVIPPLQAAPNVTVPEQNCALYFVKHNGEWLWHCQVGLGFWDTWEYDYSSPHGALRSIDIAVARRDVVAVWEAIDPGLRTIDRGEFVRAANERCARVSEWQKARKSEPNRAPNTGQPIARQTSPPYEILDDNGGYLDVECETLRENSEERVRVWRLGNKDKPIPRDRQQSELFVQRGDKWYWQPKPEYAAWPVGPNAPAATQPAPDSAK